MLRASEHYRPGTDLQSNGSATAKRGGEFAHLRRPQPAALCEPSAATIRWVASFPKEVRPMQLAIKFPRIANILADAWPHPGRFEARLRELMLNDRPGRQGFPFDVLKELADLNAYFDSIRHKMNPNNVWRSVAER